VPVTYFYYRRLESRLGIDDLKINPKKDWERLGIAMSLVLTLVATLLSLQNFFGQTVTQSSCYKPSDKINVTSPNCAVIQTVSIPQSTSLGSLGILFLDVLLLSLAAFGGWLFILYYLKKVESK